MDKITLKQILTGIVVLLLVGNLGFGLFSLIPQKQVASDDYSISVGPQFFVAMNPKSFTINVEQAGKPVVNKQLRISFEGLNRKTKQTGQLASFLATTDQNGKIVTERITAIAESRNYDGLVFHEMKIFTSGSSSSQPILVQEYNAIGTFRAQLFYGPQFSWTVGSLVITALVCLVVVPWLGYINAKEKLAKNSGRVASKK
ncbi:MAG TPA: hypothetical protein VLA77_03795 [Candidatus Saccharimonadales bacterium]|nr:hypothetical protein [Candidatus Saccharimonadales bacterium]